MDIKKHRVLNVLLNTGSLDRYTLAVVDVYKDIETNKIRKAVIPKGLLKENILLEEAKTHTRRIFLNSRPDYVISTQYKFIKDAYRVDLYANKNEHELAKYYIDNFEVLENRVSALQQVSNGEGIFLVEGDSQKAHWKLDHMSLRMSTYAFMFSMELVSKNRTLELLKALEEE
ncbi:hypothetical protein [Sulfurovum sp.]|uniref:hypothetical protein n=1 Tax=Sulfurovum sp. TaxID=1969726 RepID=UPI0025EA3B85|nr:hypothetical protein [Sulfurovum sp.]